MVKEGLIDKERKDEIKDLTYSAKKARDFLSHNVSLYPDSDDALKLLGSAIKLTKMSIDSPKFKED